MQNLLSIYNLLAPLSLALAFGLAAYTPEDENETDGASDDETTEDDEDTQDDQDDLDDQDDVTDEETGDDDDTQESDDDDDDSTEDPAELRKQIAKLEKANKRVRKEAQQRREENERLKASKKKGKEKGKDPEKVKALSDLATSQDRVKDLEGQLFKKRVDGIVAAEAKKLRFLSPALASRLLELDDLEDGDDDETIANVSKAGLKLLAAKAPEMIAKKKVPDKDKDKKLGKKTKKEEQEESDRRFGTRSYPTR